jgi:hypothetical protein
MCLWHIQHDTVSLERLLHDHARARSIGQALRTSFAQGHRSELAQERSGLSEGTSAPASLWALGEGISQHLAPECGQALVESGFDLGQGSGRVGGAPGIHLGKNVQPCSDGWCQVISRITRCFCAMPHLTPALLPSQQFESHPNALVAAIVIEYNERHFLREQRAKNKD